MEMEILCVFILVFFVSTQADGTIEVLAYRFSQGVTDNPYDVINSSAQAGDVAPANDLDIPLKSTFKHPIMDRMKELDISQIKLGFRTSEGTVQYLTFKPGLALDKMSWMSQVNLIDSPWNDLTQAPVFSIVGDTGGDRRFHVGKVNDQCERDAGWLVVVGEPSSGETCPWEKQTMYPSILYSIGDGSVIWQNSTNVSHATDLVIEFVVRLGSADNAQCRPLWAQVGNTFYSVHKATNPSNYVTSSRTCVDNGGQLAEPRSAEISAALLTEVQVQNSGSKLVDDYPYLGGSRGAAGSEWQWANENVFGYSNWYGPGCPPEWTPYKSSCYRLLPCTSEDLCTVDKAEHYCSPPESALAIIRSEEENNFLAKMGTGLYTVYIGLKQKYDNNTAWIWHDQSSATYTNWDEGQPSSEAERCVRMKMKIGGKWGDVKCGNLYSSVDKTAFACQKTLTECKDGWTQNKVKCYKYHECTSAEPCFGDAGARMCLTEGAYLTSIQSAEENEFVGSFAGERSYVFVGGRDDVIEGLWQWPDGSNLTYTNWAQGEPKNNQNENCMIVTGESNLWNDASCLLPSPQLLAYGGGYVCETPHFGCQSGWTGYNNSCYKFHRCEDEASCTISTSQSRCFAQGATLIKIQSEKHQTLVASLTTSEIIHVFIGLGDDVTEGLWLWRDGSVMTYSNWAAGEPSEQTQTGEDCAEILHRWGDTWNELGCTTARPAAFSGFVCQKIGADTATGETTCPLGWKQWTNKQCYLYQACSIDTDCTAESGKSTCSQYGSTLAIITSYEENIFVGGMGGEDVQYLFIGATDVQQEGMWVWPNDEVLTFGMWAKGQPDNYYPEKDCVAQTGGPNSDMKWYDYDCGQRFNPTQSGFVCEMRRDVPEPTQTEGETCMRMVSNGQWRDTVCTETSTVVACETPADAVVWTITVKTGTLEGSDTISDVSYLLGGSMGVSNWISPHNSGLYTTRGHAAEVMLRTPFIGSLHNISMKLNDAGDPWNVESVRIQDMSPDGKTYINGCNCWFEDTTTSRILTAHDATKWKLTIKTGETGSSTAAPRFRLGGSMGYSHWITPVVDEYRNGSSVVLDVWTTDIGQLVNVTVEMAHKPGGGGDNMRLDSVIVDGGTFETLLFFAICDCLLDTAGQSFTLKPITVNWTLSVQTGSEAGSGSTSAEPSYQLAGSLGVSRWITPKIDVYAKSLSEMIHVQTVDIGRLHNVTVRMGYKSNIIGTWKLHSMTITSSEAPDMFVVAVCYCWLTNTGITKYMTVHEYVGKRGVVCEAPHDHLSTSVLSPLIVDKTAYQVFAKYAASNPALGVQYYWMGDKQFESNAWNVASESNGRVSCESVSPSEPVQTGTSCEFDAAKTLCNTAILDTGPLIVSPCLPFSDNNLPVVIAQAIATDPSLVTTNTRTVHTLANGVTIDVVINYDNCDIECEHDVTCLGTTKSTSMSYQCVLYRTPEPSLMAALETRIQACEPMCDIGLLTSLNVTTAMKSVLEYNIEGELYKLSYCEMSKIIGPLLHVTTTPMMDITSPDSTSEQPIPSDADTTSATSSSDQHLLQPTTTHSDSGITASATVNTEPFTETKSTDSTRIEASTTADFTIVSTTTDHVDETPKDTEATTATGATQPSQGSGDVTDDTTLKPQKRDEQFCKCECTNYHSPSNDSNEKKETILQMFINTLLGKIPLVTTKNSTLSRHRWVSASDNRTSAVGVGSVGVTMLVTVMGVVVVVEAPILLLHAKTAYGNIKDFFVGN